MKIDLISYLFALVLDDLVSISSQYHLPNNLLSKACNHLIFPCRIYLGVELLKSEGSESILKSLWHHTDAVMCCSLKVWF